MAKVTRTSVRKMMEDIMKRQGKALAADESTRLHDAGFRSLDFAELALRVESVNERPLEFEAGVLRSIETVKDVLDFMERAAGVGA
jgi:acyl carrier protein